MKKWLLAASGYSVDPDAPDVILLTLWEDGRLEALEGLHQGDNPSFLCVKGGNLYTASEMEDYARVTWYQVQGHTLKKQNERTVEGKVLCHLEPSEKGLFGSCYGDGTAFLVNHDLSEVLWARPGANREGKQSRCHWGTHSPDGEYILFTDLGLDEVRAYLLCDGIPDKENGIHFLLTPGCGPRQVVFSKDGNYVYAADELGSMVDVLTYEKPMHLRMKFRLPATETGVENFPGGACIAEDGAFFVANRGANTVGIFSPVQEGLVFSGEVPCGGVWPRHLQVVGEEGFLMVSNQESGEICCFAREGTDLIQKSSFRFPGVSCVMEIAKL